MTRLTSLPDPSTFDEEELDAFRELERQKQNPMPRPAAHAGQAPRAGGHGGLALSPMIALALNRTGIAVTKRHSRPGSYGPYEHEMIDEVLSFALGHWGLLRLHVPNAVASGVRIEAIEALRDGRDEDLDDYERQLAQFVRQVIGGTVTDESWAGMRDKLGSDKAVVEYTFHILLLNTHVRLLQAFDAPDVSREELDTMLEGLRNGSVPLPDIEAYETWIRTREKAAAAPA
jgi:hypothetical protein